MFECPILVPAGLSTSHDQVFQWLNYGRCECLEEDMQRLIKTTIMIVALTDWKVTQHTNSKTNPTLISRGSRKTGNECA